MSIPETSNRKAVGGSPDCVRVRCDGSHVICDSSLARRRSRTAVILIAVPALATFAALCFSFIRPVGSLEVALLLGMMFLTVGVGISVGYHRCFTHRSFDASPVIRVLLGVAGAMAFQGPPLYWVSLHRRHHENSDHDGDPHSPSPLGDGWIGRIKGLWYGHFGWIADHEIPSTIHYAPDILKDRSAMWVNRFYLQLALLGFLLPTVIGAVLTRSCAGAASGFLWGGMVRLFLSSNFIWSINSVCHVFGRREYDTTRTAVTSLFSRSRHLERLGTIIIMPFRVPARFGLRWWQIDIGYAVIVIFRRIGLAHNVKVADVLSSGHLDAPLSR